MKKIQLILTRQKNNPWSTCLIAFPSNSAPIRSVNFGVIDPFDLRHMSKSTGQSLSFEILWKASGWAMNRHLNQNYLAASTLGLTADFWNTPLSECEGCRMRLPNDVSVSTQCTYVLTYIQY